MFGKLKYSYHGKNINGKNTIKIVVQDLCHTVIFEETNRFHSVSLAEDTLKEIIKRFKDGSFDDDPRRVIMV